MAEEKQEQHRDPLSAALSQSNYGSTSCFLFCFTYLQLVSWGLNEDPPLQSTMQPAKATARHSETT